MTNARIGAGSQLKMGDGTTPTEVFTKVGDVVSLGEIGYTLPEQDVTPIDATAREYIGGLAEGNTVSITISYDAQSTQHKALRDARGANASKNFQVVWADGEQADFTLIITSYARSETTAEGVMQATIEGRISGEVVWTDA